MIKISKSSNMITITDSVLNYSITTLGANCLVRVKYELNPNDVNLRQKVCSIANKYNGKTLAIVTSDTLDPTSTSYSADMDVYSTNLITSVFYS